jgi:hypothetical protein
LTKTVEELLLGVRSRLVLVADICSLSAPGTQPTLSADGLPRLSQARLAKQVWAAN